MPRALASRVLVAGLFLSLVLLAASMGDEQMTGDAYASNQPQRIMLPLVAGKPPTFSVNSSASPAVLSAGKRVDLTVKVTNTSDGNSTNNVVMTVKDPLGAQVYEKQWPSITFQSNNMVSLSDGYTPDESRALGTYSVAVRVTSSDGTSIYYSNGRSTSF